MANTIGDSNFNVGQFHELREQRQVARESRVSEATDLISAQRLDAGTIAEHQGFCNGILDDTARLKGGGLLGGLGLGEIFRTLEDDRKINEATRPDPRDNDKASDIKSEYKKAHEEVKRETAQASRIAQKLGPGTHALSNGDRVTVTVDPKSGEQTVKTVRPDGSTKEVTTGCGEGSVKKTWPDGRESELRQDGTTVSRHDKDMFGETDTRYGLDGHGRVVRDKSGPAVDDDERTVVNKDGSTDTRTFVYEDEHGRKVYEKKHEPGHDVFDDPFPRPEPHPFPRPQPMPFPGPWDHKPVPMPLPVVDLGGRGDEDPLPVPMPTLPDDRSPGAVPMPTLPGDGHFVRLPDGTEIDIDPGIDMDRWKRERRLPDAIPFRGGARTE